MSAFGILSCSAYIPRKRMSRAAIFDAVGWAQPSLKGLVKGARAFGAWDEDAITMAVAAARNTIKSAPKTEPTALCFASTTAPFLDRQNAGVVAAALDLSSRTHVFDVAGSQRAATSALIRFNETRSGAPLLAAADRRRAKSASTMEMLSGDAGAALLLGEGEPIAEIVGVSSIYADLVDHYRTAQSETDYVLEERWYRDEGVSKLATKAAGSVLKNANLTGSDIKHLIAPFSNSQLARTVAKQLEIASGAIADSLFYSCGHAGAAHPILMLANVLAHAKPDEWILLTVFGQGCDTILLRTTQAIADANRTELRQTIQSNGQIEENYTRFLSSYGAIDIDWGLRAERDNRTAQTVAYNKSRDLYGFVGGLCYQCDTPQFPKSRRCVNPECNALDTQRDHRFADLNATVKSFTEDWLAFTREPPLIYGNVSFEGGGNVFMEMTGFRSGDIAIGAPVEMTFRIKDIDAARGFHRYFWKATPVVGGAHG
ncbi:MAG: 3-oxoacyl-[acyl-carrier-protein] synthase III C-terminal domain-containing protein [Pseudomonadota bacterium]